MSVEPILEPEEWADDPSRTVDADAFFENVEPEAGAPEPELFHIEEPAADASLSAHPYLADQLDATRRFVRRFVVVSARELDAIALWNAHTYVYRCAQATPYLHPHSPEPGSGKTTLLDVLELTACGAVQADGISEAALFRLIDKKRPTLLFDEVDAVFGKKNSDSTEGIRQVLNSGYRKDKRVYRCVPPAHDVAAFDVFCPKATAGLHELPGTLASRSIPIEMKPLLPTEACEELDRELVEDEAEILRQNLQSWADESRVVLQDRSLRPTKLAELDARGNEIWRLLFRIANLAGGDWPARAKVAAVELSGRGRNHQDASVVVRLLGHIRDVFPDDRDRMSCSSLVDALNSDELLPYGGWSDGKGITTRELGKKLAPYGVKAKKIRLGTKTLNGYERDQFEDAWGRYLPPNPPSNRNTGTTSMVEPKNGENKPEQEAVVPVSEKGAIPHGQMDVPVVPVSRSKDGREAVNGRIPLPGDPGFPLHVDVAHQNGHLTARELAERLALHRFVHAGGAEEDEPERDWLNDDIEWS